MIVTQLNMRQSKVARSFEAQRKGDDSEAMTELRAENQHRRPRDFHLNEASRVVARSKARIIEEEGERTEERGRASNRNVGVVQRKNEMNKPTPRSESQNYHNRGAIYYSCNRNIFTFFYFFNKDMFLCFYSSMFYIYFS